MKLKLRYENEEEEVVEIKRVEPEGDFDPPKSGTTVCCTANGSKYTATIVEIINKKVYI